NMSSSSRQTRNISKTKIPCIIHCAASPLPTLRPERSCRPGGPRRELTFSGYANRSTRIAQEKFIVSQIMFYNKAVDPAGQQKYFMPM
ncbi:hypothetical protein, partial [Klebsiella oxytoca]|uniref:hypothetical protein n=1 Tax=Klebsiella oxytoca TaxID=571 RepID=UPI001C8F6D41